jgi:hypothetical protein
MVAAALALVAVFLGNVLRSVGLFYFEAKIVHAPPWAHAATGVVAFALTAMAIMWLVGRLARQARRSSSLSRYPGRGRGEGSAPNEKAAATHRTPLLIAHVALCALAATLPIITPTPAPAANLTPFPGWPTHFEGRPLLPSPMADHERGFLDEFPGRVAKFTDGQRQIVLRWTPVATRKLHLSSDCFRGAGFSITPRSAVASTSGIEYSRFVATRGGEALAVSERIYDDVGRSWPDASSWYWSATTGRTSGPWWAVTIVETARRD